MAPQKKCRVMVLYGGRSAEHEVSCRSAAFILKNLDLAKYEVLTVAIDKDGKWLPQDATTLLRDLNGPLKIKAPKAHRDFPALPASWEPGSSLMATANPASIRDGGAVTDNLVVFPILHGTFGEDGTLQGMLDLAQIAYVGADTLGSAIGMDKIVAKKLVEAAGIAVVPWVALRRARWDADRDSFLDEAIEKLGLPIFVKPAGLGSSVGISRAETRDALAESCRTALDFDDKILLEQALEVREIECAALGDYEPDISIPGEVIPHAEFYTYEAKYLDENGASLVVPADLDDSLVKEVQEMSRCIFMALELYGMARIDLFLEKGTNRFFFNEVNTIPGFTEISQYPMLWNASGVGSVELLDRLIDLAVKRQRDRAGLKRSM